VTFLGPTHRGRIGLQMAGELNPNLVREVSRSFSLSLLVLPKQQRPAIGLVYLLARLGDTLSDTGQWSIADRLGWLNALESAVLSKRPELWNFSGTVGSVSSGEAELILGAKSLLETYRDLDKSFHEIADELLKTLYSGMRWDLSTFSQSSGKQALWGCRDDSMFDWYCFTVAGCVGRFWARAFGLDSSLELLAVEYGKALQRINVIRDVREDWDRGRVYLPQSLLAVSSAGKAPWEDSGWKSFCDAYMKKTRAMLQIGANFCDAIPFGSFRLRYASILPLAIGWKTLGLLEENEFWKNHHKISRKDIKQVVLRSLLDVALHRRLSSRYILDR